MANILSKREAMKHPDYEAFHKSGKFGALGSKHSREAFAEFLRFKKGEDRRKAMYLLTKRYHLSEATVNQLAGIPEDEWYYYQPKHHISTSSQKTEVKRGGVQTAKGLTESEKKALQQKALTGKMPKIEKEPVVKEEIPLEPKLAISPAIKDRQGKSVPAIFFGQTKEGKYVEVGTGAVEYGLPEETTVSEKIPFKSKEELEKYTVKEKIRAKDIPSLLYELDKKRIEMQLSILGGATAKVKEKLHLHEPSTMTRTAFKKKYPNKSYESYLQHQEAKKLGFNIPAGIVEIPYMFGSQIYGGTQFIEKTIKEPKTYPKKAIKSGIEDIQLEYRFHPQRFAGKQIGAFIGMAGLSWGLQKLLTPKTTTSASITEIKSLGKGKYAGKGKIVTKAGKQKITTDVKSLMKTQPERKITKSYGLHELTTSQKKALGLTKGISKKTSFQKIYAHLTEGKILSKLKGKIKTTDIAGKYVSKSLNKKYSVHVGETITGKGAKGVTGGFTKFKYDVSKILFKSGSKVTKTKGITPKTIYKSHLGTLGAGLKATPTYSFTPSVTAGIIGLSLIGSTKKIKSPSKSLSFVSSPKATAPQTKKELHYKTPAPTKVLRTPEKQAHFSRVGTIKPKTKSRVITAQNEIYSNLLGTKAERTLKSQKTKIKTKQATKTETRLSLSTLLGATTAQKPRVVSKTKQPTLTTSRMVQILHSGHISPKQKVVPPFTPAFFSLPHLPETKKSKKSYKPIDLNYLLRINPVATSKKEIEKLLKRL